jgi:hypothetical protein
LIAAWYSVDPKNRSKTLRKTDITHFEINKPLISKWVKQGLAQSGPISWHFRVSYS